MRTIALLASILVVTSFVPSLKAEDVIKDKSPDGKFAMLLKEPDDLGVRIQLIEVSSRKLILDLAQSGHPDDERCKILWASDSQRFAFYEATRRGGITTVFFRNESGFTESRLPELPDCRTAAQKKEIKAHGLNNQIEYNTEPKEWLKSSALMVANDNGWETNDEHLLGCTETVTIGFDAKHKASVLRVADKKAKEY